MSEGIDKIAGSVATAAESIGSVGTGLSDVGTGIKDIGTGLSMLQPLELVSIANGLNEIRDKIVRWYNDKDKLLEAAPIITGLTDSVREFAEIDSQVANVGSLVSGLGDIFTFLNDNMDRKGNLKNVDNLAKSISEALSGALTAVQDFIPKFQVSGSDLSTNFIEAIRSKAAEAQSVAGDMALAAYRGAKAYTEFFETIGYNMGVGLANGLAESSYIVVEMATQIAEAARDTIKNILRIQSPSKVFEELGHYMDLGLARGIEGSTGEVQTATEIMAQNTVNFVTEAISRISDTLQNSSFTPSITPVIDLDNAASGAHALSALYGSLGFNTGRYQIDASLLDKSSQSKDIVNEIQSLKGQLGQLAENMENLQIVLDTGTLVGSTSAMYDSQFGTMTMHKNRGN